MFRPGHFIHCQVLIDNISFFFFDNNNNNISFIIILRRRREDDIWEWDPICLKQVYEFVMETPATNKTTIDSI